jgi:hypothetical protein
MVVFPKPDQEAAPAGAMHANENPFAGLRLGRWYRVSWAGQQKGGHSECYPGAGRLEWLHPRGLFAVFRTRGGYRFTVHRSHAATGVQILPAAVDGGRGRFDGLVRGA